MRACARAFVSSMQPLSPSLWMYYSGGHSAATAATAAATTAARSKLKEAAAAAAVGEVAQHDDVV